jgi:hypothetical protein
MPGEPANSSFDIGERATYATLPTVVVPASGFADARTPEVSA